MCITKKAAKKTTPDQVNPVAEKKKKKGFNAILKKKTPKKTSAEDREVTGAAPSVADMANQLGEENGRLEDTPAASGAEPSPKSTGVPQKLADPKRLDPKRPSTEKGQCNSSLSGNRGAPKKKMLKFKWGQVDRDELSINNDKTEYLENAQLTKLMSHADVKALMGGQLAQGMDADENSCRDTVEEVDSEMQDIAFSPLLAGIAKEDEKGYGVLPNPQEQREKKQETA